eukprot:10418536-Alexandrium_andersonii.AAC.1
MWKRLRPPASPHSETSLFRAAPLAPRAATERVADFRRFRGRDKDVSPCRPAGGRSLFHMDFGPLLNYSQ